MRTLHPIPPSFYTQPTLIVARQLIGAVLRVEHPLGPITAVITETEAYIGENDLACHCRAGKTKRTQVMYGPPGHAYVYFTYGNHWMLNAVTDVEGAPAAVLIRAVLVLEGKQIVQANRLGVPDERWSDGPGKLTKACGIDASFNEIDLTNPNGKAWIAYGRFVEDDRVTIGPRVGLYTVPEPWKSKPWRFLWKTNNQLEEQWDYSAEKTP